MIKLAFSNFSPSDGDIGGEEAKRLKAHGSPNKAEGGMGVPEATPTAQQSHTTASSDPLSPTSNGELMVQTS